MGLMDTLFGGSKVIDTNDSEINHLADRLAHWDSGYGPAGRMAMKGLKRAFKKGDMGSLPSVQLAIARGAANWTDLQRQLQMNTAMMPGEQSALSAGILQKGMLQNQNNTGQAAVAGAANDISNFMNIADQAFGRQRGMQFQGVVEAANLRQRGRQVVQKKGLVQGITEIGNMVNPFRGLIPGLGGSRGGGGGS